MKLHLGCGTVILPGWVNMDLEAGPGVTVGDVRTLDGVAERSVDVIYAGHVLDHLGRNETDAVLKVWFSRLRPGGTLRLAVSSFEAAVEEYRAGRPLSSLLGILVGGHKTAYDRHGTLFDRASLTAVLERAGFVRPRLWDWREVEHGDHDDFSQAYLPHMDKDHGRLMSLNMEADRPSVEEAGQRLYREHAATHGTGPLAGVQDFYVRSQETSAILRTLETIWTSRTSPQILEVGCGNGTLLAALHLAGYGDLTAMDSLPEFVELARRQETGARVTVGNVRRLEYPSNSFDVVISERVVINLASADDQRASVGEMARVLRPGGHLIMLEAFTEPWQAINAARGEFDLPPLPMPAHNRWLTEHELTAWDPRLRPQPVATPRGFLGGYYYAARVLHDVLLRAVGRSFTGSDSSFVRMLAPVLPAEREYSIIQFLCFQKESP